MKGRKKEESEEKRKTPIETEWCRTFLERVMRIGKDECRGLVSFMLMLSISVVWMNEYLT